MSNTLGNTTKQGRVATNTLYDLFQAYDGLPPPIRAALNAAKFNWSPIECQEALKAGLTIEQICQTIELGDIAMIETEQQPAR